jgi:hypothetical protein
MRDRLPPDQTPATLNAVVAAVIAASRYDESELQEIASEGSLRKLFPFMSRAIDIPPDTMAREQLRRASAFPIGTKARKALVLTSMSSTVHPFANQRDKDFEEFVADWRVDI